MESVQEMIEKEETTDRLWDQVKGWNAKRIVNYLVNEFPLCIAKDLAEKIEAMPEEEKTPREAYTEGHQRAGLKTRLLTVVGEDILDLDKERLVEEMALELQVPALEEFVSHLESSGEEICKTWRVKLVSIAIGKNPDNDKKASVFGYFKTDIDEEELTACHKAFLRQNDWEFETSIPDGYHWKLNTDLKEFPDAVSTNTGWTRYLIGSIT
jgi:hypothetical protein